MIKGNFKVIASLFRVILPEKSFFGNILVILDDLLDQKVNFNVKYDFNILATNWSTYNTLF